MTEQITICLKRATVRQVLLGKGVKIPAAATASEIFELYAQANNKPWLKNVILK